MSDKPDILRAPFPWFGGKRRAASVVWPRFGDLPNYNEPFCGSLANLLGRPTAPRVETVNDIDCYVSNFWRAIHSDPECVAHHADWPINEADLHARHNWLVGRAEFRERMKLDPDYYVAKIAGWWVWGICQWIGGGWCRLPEPPGQPGEEEKRPWRERPHLRNAQGVHNARAMVERPWRKIPASRRGRGYLNPTKAFPKRPIPMLGGDGSGSGRGVHRNNVELIEWFFALRDRLRGVRVCCGNWQRILGLTPTTHIGLTGVFLDPPYSREANRYDRGLYAQDDLDVAVRVREWAIANGDNRKLRIALCGYEGEHIMPPDWECVAWHAGGGYARAAGKENRKKERIWFSPHCLKPEEAEAPGILC